MTLIILNESAAKLEFWGPVLRFSKQLMSSSFPGIRDFIVKFFSRYLSKSLSLTTSFLGVVEFSHEQTLQKQHNTVLWLLDSGHSRLGSIPAKF